MRRAMLQKIGGGFDFFLDAYSGAHSAFSLRKLSSTYTGDCIEAIRFSDSATLDVGFVNNQLDTGTLITFAGASDVGILTWYDQSGNGRDYNGVTVGSKLPEIFVSGNLVTENSKPSILFTGTAPYFEGSLNILNNKPALSVVAVAKKTGSSAGQLLFISTDANAGIARAGLSYDSVANKITLGGRRLNANSAQTISSSNNYTGNLESILGVLDYANSDAYLYLNGTLEASTTSFQTSGNTPSGNVLNNRLGRQAATTNIFNGFISELIIYETPQQANASGMDLNISNYYGT